MSNLKQEALQRLFFENYGLWPTSCEMLPASGSDRKYFRMTNSTIQCIGAINSDKKENDAFIAFSRALHDADFPVPEVYAYNESDGVWLLQDLGDTTLFSFLARGRSGSTITDEVKSFYYQVISLLPALQIKGAEVIPFEKCYPRAAFDERSMRWDLNYFKYYFLRLSHVPFDEQRLEDDFDRLVNRLCSVDSSWFLFRDFQSRNIMIHDQQVWFIDYQGGRKGALHYDLASLLYDGKADLPESFRQELLERYLEVASSYISIDRTQFKQDFYGFVLIRILQAMGAYGFRGFYEQKSLFLQSIPYALKNLTYLLDNDLLPHDLPELHLVLRRLTTTSWLYDFGKRGEKLIVTVKSFSYKKGIPTDSSGNGGGFVFDCRGLPNPGRLDGLKEYTGLDEQVSDYLEHFVEVQEFKDKAFGLVDLTVQNYLSRGFSNLMVSFGCTGGQHRSVYMAENLSRYLKETFDAEINLQHRECDNWPQNKV